MLTAEQMREILKDANIRKVSRSSGVNYQPVLRLLKGGGIKHESMVKLSNYLENCSDAKDTSN